MIAYHYVPADPGVIEHCTMRGCWQLKLRKPGARWLIRQWAVRRTAPWEGSPDVYGFAAARATPQASPRQGEPSMFYEMRTEHAHPGRGAELARYMDATVIPLHQDPRCAAMADTVSALTTKTETTIHLTPTTGAQLR